LGENQLTNASDFSTRASQAEIDAITSADSSTSLKKLFASRQQKRAGQQIKLAAAQPFIF